MPDLLDHGTADPRNLQKRFATTPSGRLVGVDITSDDRLKAVHGLPSRWPDVIMARERGESLEDIAKWAKVPPPCRPGCRFEDATVEGLEIISDRVHVGPECLSWFIAECYNHIEARLNELAEQRAKWMV